MVVAAACLTTLVNASAIRVGGALDRLGQAHLVEPVIGLAEIQHGADR
jgi:hypothetical protein